MIHQRGGLAIPPHPYDLFRAGIRFSTLETLPVDAIEVFNAATTLAAITVTPSDTRRFGACP